MITECFFIDDVKSTLWEYYRISLIFKDKEKCLKKLNVVYKNIL